MLAYYITLAKRLKADRKGVTSLEYGVIAAVTVAAVGAAMGPIGTNLTKMFTTIAGLLAPH